MKANKDKNNLKFAKQDWGITKIKGLQNQVENILRKEAKYSSDLVRKYFQALNQQKCALRKKCDKYTQIADIFARIGWPISPELDVTEAEQWLTDNNKDLEQLIISWYEDDDYKNLKKEFNLIENLLSQDKEKTGYLRQVQIVRSEFFNNPETYLISINCLISIIDYEFVDAFDQTNSNIIMSKTGASKFEDRLEKEEYKDFMAISSSETLIKFLESSDFKSGINNTKFTRHSIQHGRFNPNRLKLGHFIQVVCLLSSVCYLNKIMKDGEYNTIKEEIISDFKKQKNKKKKLRKAEKRS